MAGRGVTGSRGIGVTEDDLKSGDVTGGGVTGNGTRRCEESADALSGLYPHSGHEPSCHSPVNRQRGQRMIPSSYFMNDQDSSLCINGANSKQQDISHKHDL
jgi:hypothetical protein